jgi:hypothetical protein
MVVKVARMPVSGFAYKIGVKNIKKVTTTEIKFPMSLITPLRIERRSPSPRVIRRMGNMKNNAKRIVIDGINPYTKNNIQTKMNWIRNETMDWPRADITRDFFEKFILTIIGPAFTSELEQLTTPVENNCQNAIPKIA